MKIEPQPLPTISSRPIAQGADWSIDDVVCRAGPQDRPFEERHGRVSIAAVIAGTFHYRGDAGAALLYPGSLMLGNAGTCFECGHKHGTGDRCIAFHFAPSLFEEVSATAAGSHCFRFTAPMLPAMPDLMPMLVEIEASSGSARAIAGETLALRLVELVGGALSGVRAPTLAPSSGDARRVSAVLRYIEHNADGAIDLDRLAAMAAISKYHFLRVFRRVTGLTPYKFLLGVRMRRAAVRLRTSRAPVSQIAFEAGFGDLSTFNKRFRDLFGATPSRFRLRAGVAA
ncbi:MAG: AraC family transcriptional regulator [Alphaproteobacteria bacterium]|nr:AraC family transcriptional regulator [Alphaproteobacteria bacterium]